MTTSPMILKFHMQHDKAAGLQKNKIQAAREQIWPLLLKIAKPLKSNFPPEPLGIFGLNFVESITCTLIF